MDADVKALAETIYAGSNSDLDHQQTQIYEMTVTANMHLSKMEEQNIKWPTTDSKLEASTHVRGSNLSAVELAPMKIRMFCVAYISWEELLS